MSFTPFVGLHFLLSAILAWLIRANVVASALGTAVGNPWTFPFIWVWIYELGHWMGVGEDVENIETLDFSAIFGRILEATLNGDVDAISASAGPVFSPMLLGSFPTTIIVWIVFYVPLRKLVEEYQIRRARKRARLKEETK